MKRTKEKKSGRVFWTSKEDKLLKKHYTTATREELERLLQRTISSIRYRATVVLKLKRVDQERVPWSEDEDNLLKKLYPEANWDELFRALRGRSQPSIYSRARLLGLTRMAPTHRPWSEEEEEILKKNFGSLWWPELLKLLPGRTRAAIVIHGQFQGLTRLRKDRNPWSEEEIALLKETVLRLKNATSSEAEDVIMNEFKNKVKRSYLAISRKLSELGFS